MRKFRLSLFDKYIFGKYIFDNDFTQITFVQIISIIISNYIWVSHLILEILVEMRTDAIIIFLFYNYHLCFLKKCYVLPEGDVSYITYATCDLAILQKPELTSRIPLQCNHTASIEKRPVAYDCEIYQSA